MAKAIRALQKAWKDEYLSSTTLPAWTASSDAGVTTSLTLESDTAPPAGYRRRADCLFHPGCERTFSLPEHETALLEHLLVAHRVLVDRPNLVSDLAEYLSYWRRKLERGVQLGDFGVVVKADVVRKKQKGKGKVAPPEEKGDEVAEQEDFYMLTDALTEDRELRMELQRRRLREVLHWQEVERNDTETLWNCLFCRTSFTGWHGQLLDHMARDHNFSVGQPHNLVFVKHLVEILEGKMDGLVCIFCDKTFTTRDVLKEHMRKKGHKKINPSDSSYDRFYVVNYQEFGKTWGALARETQFDDDDESAVNGFNVGAGAGADNAIVSASDDDAVGDEADWEEWRADPEKVTCLFCPANYLERDDLLTHMTSIHDFDYHDFRNKQRLDFYHQVKFINFVRRRMHLNECMFCGEKSDSRELVLEHMESSDHFRAPEDNSEWDRPDFLFPTYEDDNLLCNLDDDIYDGGDAASSPGGAPVESEDTRAEEIVRGSLLSDERFRRSITSGH